MGANLILCHARGVHDELHIVGIALGRRRLRRNVRCLVNVVLEREIKLFLSVCAARFRAGQILRQRGGGLLRGDLIDGCRRLRGLLHTLIDFALYLAALA